MLDVLDIQRIADLAHKAGALLMVDNVFASPIGQSPLKLGADVVLYSCTKHIDGQGRVLGGAVLGSDKWVKETLQPFTRNTGNALSPFNAWVLLKGLETLKLRTEAMARNAADVADALAGLPGVVNVRYPGRRDHPQHELAQKQMSNGGSLVAFEVENGKAGAFACLNAFGLIAISNNLGDARSLASRANAVGTGAAPVILSAHPGTQLDIDARKLNTDDLEDAAKHHDHPVVLVGSAPLSAGKNDEALFVQLQSARLCGSAGCTTSVYLRHNDSWKTVLDSVNGDISVLPTRHKGMHDLLVGKNDKWIWDGNEYQDTLSAPPMPKMNGPN